MIMFQRFVVGLACFAGTFFWEVRNVNALGGNLKTPSISIPLSEPNGGQNPIAAEMNRVLADHQKQFVSGSFINARSTMYFTGNTVKLNAVLKDLAEVKGAVISIMFSKESGVVEQPCRWSIDHNGWANAENLTLTVYLGDGSIQLDELVLPEIRGTTPTPKSVEFPIEKKPGN